MQIYVSRLYLLCPFAAETLRMEETLVGAWAVVLVELRNNQTFRKQLVNGISWKRIWCKLFLMRLNCKNKNIKCKKVTLVLTKKDFLTLWHLVLSTRAFKLLSILFSHKFISRSKHFFAIATNCKEDVTFYKPFCLQQWCHGEGMRERMGQQTSKRTNEWRQDNELESRITCSCSIFKFTCFWLSFSPHRGLNLFGQGSRQFWDFMSDLIWLKIRNEHSTHAWKIHSGQKSRRLLLTKRITASVEEFSYPLLGWSMVFICLLVC